MGIEMKNRQVAILLRQGFDDRKGDGMISANRYWTLTALNRLGDSLFNCSECILVKEFEVARIGVNSRYPEVHTGFRPVVCSLTRKRFPDLWRSVGSATQIRRLPVEWNSQQRRSTY